MKFICTLFALIPVVTFGQLFVNEVMVQNSNTISDNVGEYDDWIEIYNSSNTAVDLSGYYFTDNPNNLDKHEIKSGNAALTTVPANGFLLFWADEDGNQGENHLNFKLADGESVLLVAPDGTTILSSMSVPALKDDESFGSVSDGASNKKIFEAPTPLSSNSSSLDASIEFSVNSRTFVNAFNLSLSTTANGGVLRYTTNGNNPTSSSAAYSGPIPISTTTTVKVAFFFNNGSISFLKTERFVKMSTTMANASSDIPIILIHTYNESLTTSDPKTTFWSLIEPHNGGRAHGADDPSFAGRVAMRIRGESSAGFDKKQWRCEIQNEDGSDKDVSLLGMSNDADWVLYAPGRYDRALINNPLMFELSQQLRPDEYAPQYRFVEVYYNEGETVGTGDYWGVYVLMEIPKIHKDRVDISDCVGDDCGFLYMRDKNAQISTSYTSYEYNDPESADLTSAQRNTLSNHLDDFHNALTSSDWLDPVLGYKRYFNINESIHAHIIKALLKDPDGMYFSTYFIKDIDRRIKFGPLWDCDRCINSTDLRSASPYGWVPIVNADTEEGVYWLGNDYVRPWIKDFVKDPLYRTLFYDYWYNWRKDNLLETNTLHNVIDSLVNIIDESQVRNFNRWTSANYQPRYGGFYGEIEEMKNWLQIRADWIDDQLIGPPSYSIMSGTVALNQQIVISNPHNGGTIYYTMDGSDPMTSEGAVSPFAMAYTSSFQITKPGLTYINARVLLNSGEWSAYCKQEYYLTQDYSGLVINEIHYNPFDEITPANDTVGGKNFEFIELKNCGDHTVNLNGIDFIQGGVDLNITTCLMIPPGGFVVFADDSDWFEYKYGFAPDAVYSEKLDDGGELLYLVDPTNTFIDSVRYNDAPPWPGTADKGFYSLALKDCSLDNSVAGHWAIQSVFTTPRAENYFTDFGVHGFSGIVINEIHYNPFDGVDNLTNPIAGTNYEFIELKNITEAPIDLTDVFFSRGIDYFFPENTIIQPGAFIVLAENATRFKERYGFDAFDSYGGKLSDSGESIWLERLTESASILLDVVTYDDSFPWDSQADGGDVDYSLALIDGRVNNGTRLNWKVQCGTPYTPGAENMFPCYTGLNYSGLVINEFTYSPELGNNYEFIEIVNSSNVIMNLEEVRLASAVTYNFKNMFLLPAQYTLIARDSTLFHNTYGVVPDGDYNGGLSSSGETILLVDLFGDTIDVVSYGVAAPWNTEPLQGVKSLSLIDPSLDNNTAASWCTQDVDISPKSQNTFSDTDSDSIVDCLDTCPDFNNNLIGTPCNDGDPCTIGETFSSSCICEAGVFQDSDGDGVCDEEDSCPGFDDTVDTDNNGIPDGCEDCENVIVEMSNSIIANDASAIMTILTNGRVTAGNTINYYAGQSIELAAGFEVEISAVFQAFIDSCN